MIASRWSPAVVFAFASAIPAAAAPEIGDKPPAMTVGQWVTTQPAAMPGAPGADKHVFVIDFWATWLPKCAESTARLAELHRKHEKAGLVIVGVSNEEAADVTAFVKKAKLPYAVGCDDEMATSEAWLEGVDQIPYAYVIDKAGVIVWRGDSADGADALARVVGEVLAGKFDAAAAKQAADNDGKYRKLLAELQTAYGMQEKDKVFELLDAMIALKPLELQPYLIKRQALIHFEMSTKAPDWEEKMLRAFHDDAAGLKRLVQVELDRDLAERSPSVMIRAARRAAEVADQDDAEALLLWARVQCETGQLPEAIATQEKAVSRASADRKEYGEKVLKYYRRVREIVKQAGPEKGDSTTKPASRPAKGD